ncbi:tripartite tricarboxylate transporter TctB family protein [Chthonobacter rhizosphaerae]|uniref:tripartite tricarboxylate transporter TctB family protein n=1 Tax=Chthonobacter rhizosphaerae TaxID=2735553 RepID=UPI0015EF6B1A|nr:tripartite tricarboxylate transporter TctB family protein [Chthonobacter rhizosphaerae]
MPSHVRPGPLVISLAVSAVGLGVIAATLAAPTSPMYARVGPTAFPYTVGAGLVLLGLLLGLDAWRGRWQSEATDRPDERLDMKAIGLLVAGFVAAMALVGPAGFILAATALFTLATLAFGERRIWLSALIGFSIAFATYLLFAKLLGLRMGDGLIERFL